LVGDSDVLIEHLRGREQSTAFIAELASNGELFVSTITIAELFTEVYDDRDEEAVDALIRLSRVVAVNEAIARRGGVIRAHYRQSHGTRLPDALIAATAEVIDATLVSFNRRHFPMISNLLVPYER